MISNNALRTDASYTPQAIPVCEPYQQSDFDDWLMCHSIEQLFDAHSSLALRWQVFHWIFSIPFVSKTYGDPKLRSILESAASRFQASRQPTGQKADTSIVHSVPIRSLDFEDVPFSLTEDYRVVPHPYSFESLCMRLQIDPGVFRDHIEYQMSTDGIAELIKTGSMAVKAKIDLVSTDQSDFFGGVDYSDLSLLTHDRPIQINKTSVLDEQDEALCSRTLDLFPQ